MKTAINLSRGQSEEGCYPRENAKIYISFIVTDIYRLYCTVAVIKLSQINRENVGLITHRSPGLAESKRGLTLCRIRSDPALSFHSITFLFPLTYADVRIRDAMPEWQGSWPTRRRWNRRGARFIYVGDWENPGNTPRASSPALIP